MKGFLKIVKWNETIMKNHFGNVNEDDFDNIYDFYIDEIIEDNPNIEVCVNVCDSFINSESVFMNFVEFENGEKKPVSDYSEKYLKRALDRI